jgi:hypothetical protein
MAQSGDGLRLLAMEPPLLPVVGKSQNHAGERFRILGEIPVRKFNGEKQPLDPDGNPNTSFLAKIPADTARTFQTLDKDGMVLNMAQTWHQLRPGEIRNDCGGCHQRPTLTLTYPRAGANTSLTRLLVGMSDYETGLDPESFSVVADFAVDGVKPGENLAAKFQALPENRWELRLKEPITALEKGKLTVSVKDCQGNTTRIERTFTVVPPGTK